MIIIFAGGTGGNYIAWKLHCMSTLVPVMHIPVYRYGEPAQQDTTTHYTAIV